MVLKISLRLLTDSVLKVSKKRVKFKCCLTVGLNELIWYCRTELTPNS